MNKLMITVLLSLFWTTTTVTAQQRSQNNSLFQSALEQQTSHHTQDKVETTESTHTDIHQKEKNNSLAHAVLAKQGVKQNIVITSKHQISTSQYDPDDAANSLFSAAISRHYKDTH